MPKFRRRQTEVEAEQVVLGNVWPEGVCRDVHSIAGPGGGAEVVSEPHVHTLHGPVRIKVGDWILPEPEPGKFYPVVDRVFRETYEPVEGEREVVIPVVWNPSDRTIKLPDYPGMFGV